MDIPRRLLGVFASESARGIFLFLAIMSVVAATVLVSATIVAAYTGDWNLPSVVAALILFVAVLSLYFLFRALLLLVLLFWPILIAIVMVWTGFKVLFKKKSSEGQSSEDSPKKV